MAEAAASRRERYRAETREEAKRLALGQLAESGPWALSLNAIAKQMGITGPALYRYFSGRDELLTELVVDAYEDLADTVSAAVQGAARAAGRRDARSVRTRVRSFATAYRDWALSQPHRYLLLFGTPVPGYSAPPERTTLAAQRVMATLLEVLAEAVGTAPAGRRGAADRQLEAWGEQLAGRHFPASAVRAGLAAWTRCHGVVSLEIEGHFTPLGADPALIFDAEIDALVDVLEK